jgi:prepilin-type N-terminal cleavage/methylation domain-containing protein
VLTRTASRPDSGFTLVELLLSVMLLGIISTALIGVMFAAATANQQTRQRLDGTRDEQFGSVYFGPDVQGATEVQAGVTARCGTGTAVLELRGITYDPGTLADKIMVVSYVFSTSTVDGVLTGRLERRRCEAPSPATYPLTPLTTRTVARKLDSTPPVPVCDPDPACGTTTRSVSLPLSRLGSDTPFTLTGTGRAS